MVDYANPHDKNSGDARVVKAAICAGFYPQVLRVENPASKYAKVIGGAFETSEGQGIPKLFERTQGRVFVHPSSVNAGVTKFDTGARLATSTQSPALTLGLATRWYHDSRWLLLRMCWKAEV